MISNTPAISINKLGNYLLPEKKLTDKQLTEALKYILAVAEEILHLQGFT